VEEQKNLLVLEVVDSLEDNMSITINHKEGQAYYDAANELYDMYVEAADYVIDNNLFFDLGIPFNLVDAIKQSWDNDVHWHIYGAFIFSGGVNNEQIKLLNFEADTPSGLLETSQEQLDETQFNEIYEKVSENFKRLITLDDGLDSFDERYDQWKILFSAPENDVNREKTSRFLEDMAQKAGFETSFSYLHEIQFSDDGIMDENDVNYEYWCKNYSWLDMATDESELATTITSIMSKQQAIIINPAYTLLFESKGILKILKDLYPDSPYLIKSSFEEFEGSTEHSVYGEGEDYSNFKKVYLQKQESDYKAKVFFAYEACGLSFIESNKFIKHTVN